jgi:hypothetical protein
MIFIHFIRLAEAFDRQCSIAVFEGLFPAGHDSPVQSLLYRFAQWHALAKLRIHSDSTVTFLEQTFNQLSQLLRKFRRVTCAAFETKELPREKAARQRRLAQQPESNATESSGAKTKKFNLGTYKFHAMGDYVSTIRLFSTVDSFTTQMVLNRISSIYLILNLARENLRTELSKGSIR